MNRKRSIRLIGQGQALRRDQRGITGLETAIILIAFVVVASVFAFVVLSTGLFSAERGKETVHAGLKEARGSMELRGSVVARALVNATPQGNGAAPGLQGAPGLLQARVYCLFAPLRREDAR